MDKPVKPNITIPAQFAANGTKTDFDDNKIQNGFDRLQPDVLAGDNLNKLIDDTYKGLNYAIAGTDAINLIKEGEVLTVKDGKLVSGLIETGANKDLSNLSPTGQAVLDGKANVDLANTTPKLADSFINKLMPDYSAGIDKGFDFIADRPYLLMIRYYFTDNYDGSNGIEVFVNDVLILSTSLRKIQLVYEYVFISKGDKIKIQAKENKVHIDSKICYPLKGAN